MGVEGGKLQWMWSRDMDGYSDRRSGDGIRNRSMMLMMVMMMTIEDNMTTNCRRVESDTRSG